MDTPAALVPGYLMRRPGAGDRFVSAVLIVSNVDTSTAAGRMRRYLLGIIQSTSIQFSCYQLLSKYLLL